MLAKHLPGVKYGAKLNQGREGLAHAKARLAHLLQEKYNQMSFVHLGREINITFDAYPRLNKEIAQAWDEIFGKRQRDYGACALPLHANYMHTHA